MGTAGYDRRCTLCGRMIMPADNAAFRHGQSLHLTCYDDMRSGARSITSDVSARVVCFLEHYAADYFCHTCVAACLQISRDEAAKALTRLRAIRRVWLVIGNCSRCDRPQVTLPARPLPDDGNP